MIGEDNIMKKTIFIILIVFSYSFGQINTNSDTKTFPLTSTDGLELINVKAKAIDHDGKKGIEISKANGEINGETLVIIPEINFKNGIIEIELTGEPVADANPQMRGFVGVAFRVQPSDFSSYECFYLRPTNARANNQLQRNHSTQYVSHPEYPWYRLRKESPGQYESYIDLESGKWTKIKIEVADKEAKLYVHDSQQPCLIVNDLRHEVSEGKIALWLHSSTLARYRNLVITPK
jgi:hypothetical protein